MRYWWLIAAVICLLLGLFFSIVLCAGAWILADGFLLASAALCITGLWQKGGPSAIRVAAMVVLALAVVLLLVLHFGNAAMYFLFFLW
jgi:hypothetical protein